jgi:hypothetical protein
MTQISESAKPGIEPRATAAEIEARLRLACRNCALVATVVFAGFAMLVVLALVGIVLRGQVVGATRATQLALSLSPAAGYLWATWTLRGMFQTLARDGLTFQPAVIGALGRLGTALLLGAALSMMEVSLLHLLTGAWRTGGASPSGDVESLSVILPTLTLMVTSLALTVLARMLARGARLEAETTRLKAALDDFI